MSKKSTKENGAERAEATSGEVAVERTPSTGALMRDPLQRLHVTDWFDRWPEIFSRRWPESLRDMPFVEAGFRMEQLVEDDGTLVVRGELPGLDPDQDVTITVDDDRLTISGRREERSEETDNGTRRSEFHYGSFHRSIALPSGALRDAVAATYDNGILEVRVPVDATQESVTKVPITTSK